MRCWGQTACSSIPCCALELLLYFVISRRHVDLLPAAAANKRPIAIWRRAITARASSAARFVRSARDPSRKKNSASRRIRPRTLYVSQVVSAVQRGDPIQRSSSLAVCLWIIKPCNCLPSRRLSMEKECLRCFVMRREGYKSEALPWSTPVKHSHEALPWSTSCVDNPYCNFYHHKLPKHASTSSKASWLMTNDYWRCRPNHFNARSGSEKSRKLET